MAARRTGWQLLLPCLGGLALMAVVGAAHANEDERFDCRQLADWPAPQSADEWFERSLWANHCYVFQARAVRIGIDGVRTLALSHDIQDGVEREVARFLDGPPVVFERRGRIGRLSWSEGDGEVPASPEGIARHLDQLYRITLGGEERIASRRVVRLDIEPLDNLRFGHRLWLDQQTALPMKQERIDDQGRVVETFQMTELEQPRLYEGSVVLDSRREPPALPWQPGWLPDGFIAQPVDTRSRRHSDRVGHRIYSDGLSSLSLFVEPLEEGGERLIPGLHRLGVSLAVVRHLTLEEGPVQLVVMGELPPRVLVQVAENLVWEEVVDDAQATP